MSELPVGQLAAIQDDLKALLGADPFFQRIPIFTEKQKDIESEIERALGTLEGGACIIVVTPSANVTNPNIPGPYFDDVPIVIRVVENVLINQGNGGTNIPASAIAEQVAHACHHCLTVHGKTIVCVRLALVPDDDNLIYDVTFKTKFGLAKK